MKTPLGLPPLVIAVLLLLTYPAVLLPQNSQTGELDLGSGKSIYLAACVACHGPDGKGQPDTTLVFKKPATFPDFSDCSGTTPELDADWKATIRRGGPGRGFSPIMPSFSEALTSEQIDLVIGYLRTLCREPEWPRGELNLPRPLMVDKAFPEDEVISTTTLNAHGAPGVNNEIEYEHRVGVKNEIDATVPVAFTHSTGRWLGGIGDIGLGWLRVLGLNNRTGSIFSIDGTVIAPTGSPRRGTGAGVTTFETFAAYGQLLPYNFFFQGEVGANLSANTRTAPQSLFWRESLGKGLRQGQGDGRMWTPMLEILARRDLLTGAKTGYDILPEFQVTLSRRQHVRADFGIDVPVTNTQGRPVQAVFYVLWDWFDGSLKEGW
ncbi:MAG: cytochrome c [Acidobacteriia bacterium]|nr:cytochrome c [Terriglobia bacterium]